VERADQVGKALDVVDETSACHPKDMTIPVCVSNANEAIAVIRKHHRAWLTAKKRLPA
jgi:hypothetical protein